MDDEVLDRYKWFCSPNPGKDLEAISPLKKVLHDTHLQRIYEKRNGNSFKMLLRDIVFLHNFFPSRIFMDVWLEGWSGSWVLIYVVPMSRCQGRHFSIESHMHAGSWKVFQQQWALATKLIEGRRASQYQSRQRPRTSELSMEKSKRLIRLPTRLRVLQDTAMARGWPAKCFANLASKCTTETYKTQEMRKVYDLMATGSTTLGTLLCFTNRLNFPQCCGQDGLRVWLGQS